MLTDLSRQHLGDMAIGFSASSSHPSQWSRVVPSGAIIVAFQHISNPRLLVSGFCRALSQGQQGQQEEEQEVKEEQEGQLLRIRLRLGVRV